MEGFGIDSKTFWVWLCLTNTVKLSESEYQAGFAVIIWGQNPLTFIIPIYKVLLYYTVYISIKFGEANIWRLAKIWQLAKFKFGKSSTPHCTATQSSN